MNELPKLKKILFDTKEYELISRNNKKHKFRKFEFVITEDSYKQQLALWDKYKNNANLFRKHFPQYDKEIKEKLDRLEKIYAFKGVVRAEFIPWFKDWLFNKLFKEGIV